jgi:hypothetical protein
VFAVHFLTQQYFDDALNFDCMAWTFKICVFVKTKSKKWTGKLKALLVVRLMRVSMEEVENYL